MMKRGEIRSKCNIEGTGVKDCLLAACCTPCEMAQAETELKDRAASAKLLPTTANEKLGYESVPQDQKMIYQSPAPPVQQAYPQHPQV